jgi:glycerophosphoryl diester phosphodiesterase
MCDWLGSRSYIRLPCFFVSSDPPQSINQGTMKALVIGHRGAAGLAAENTLEAMLRGLDAGADGVECDLRHDGAGRLRLLHDESLLRTFGVDRLLKEISAESLPEEKRPPSLSAFFRAMPPEALLLLEWKETPLPEALTAFEESELERRTDFAIHISFFEPALRELRQRFPSTRLLGLLDSTQLADNRQLQHWIQLARELELEGLNVEASGVTQELLDLLAGNQLDCWAWNVEDAECALRLDEWGLRGLTTDRPDWLTALLAQRGTR